MVLTLAYLCLFFTQTLLELFNLLFIVLNLLWLETEGLVHALVEGLMRHLT
jgi:hypothetical protein